MNHDDLGNYSHSYVANLRAQLKAANERAEKTDLLLKDAMWLLNFAGVAEIGARNPNVASYCKEWEDRVDKAEQTNAALKAEVERLTKECVAYRNGSGGFISSPSLHTTTSDVPESFKRGMEEIENGEVTPMFRQSAIDELNDVAEALSGEPEIARLKAERDAARALNDRLAGALDKYTDQTCASDELETEACAALSAYAKSKEAAK